MYLNYFSKRGVKRKLEDTFLMPDYYPQFSCKMGACRSACCEGWPISLSVADYFKLLGTDCSPELRKKLDCGMHLMDHPIPEAYAQISPRYDGKCPMRLEDGRCGIQAELGEGALAAVCRLYPRGIRIQESLECSCANSCEAVLEQLMSSANPVKFIRKQLSISMPEILSVPDHPDPIPQEQRIRLWLISIMQNRKYRLNDRILQLGIALDELEAVLKYGCNEKLESLLQKTSFPIDKEVQEEMTEQSLYNIGNLIQHLTSKGTSLSALGYSKITDYEDTISRFQNLFPDWECWFESILVNHMFFTQFPFENPPAALHNKFLALASIYMIMRYLCLSCENPTKTEIVDWLALLFRMVDHTDFDRYVSQIMRTVKCTSYDRLWNMLQI